MRPLGVASVLSLLVVVAWPLPAQADVGVRVTPDDVWSAWTFDPLVVLTLGVAAGLYRNGMVRIRRRSTPRGFSSIQAPCYYVALAVIGLGLLSPLDALSGQLSAAHMVQHILLVGVAAPLLVLGAPARVFAYAMPRFWREVLGLGWLAHRMAWNPLFVGTLYAAALWAWHHPTLYQAALRDPLVHDAQHLCFFVTAFLLWRVVLDPLSRRRMHPAAAAPFLFATTLHASVLAIFLTLSPTPWYADYAMRTAAFGLTPLADQQLAGLIMWAPGCLIYPLVAVAVFARWLASNAPEPNVSAGGRLV